MAVKHVFISLVLLCLCAVIVTEFHTSGTSIGSYSTAEQGSFMLYCQGSSDSEFLAVEICILTQNFVYKLHYNESLVTVRRIRCLFSAGFLPAFNTIRRRARERLIAWLILLLMAAGDIHLNPDPALRCNS